MILDLKPSHSKVIATVGSVIIFGGAGWFLYFAYVVFDIDKPLLPRIVAYHLLGPVVLIGKAVYGSEPIGLIALFIYYYFWVSIFIMLRRRLEERSRNKSRNKT